MLYRKDWLKQRITETLPHRFGGLHFWWLSKEFKKKLYADVASEIVLLAEILDEERQQNDKGIREYD